MVFVPELPHWTMPWCSVRPQVISTTDLQAQNLYIPKAYRFGGSKNPRLFDSFSVLSFISSHVQTGLPGHEAVTPRSHCSHSEQGPVQQG